MNARAWSETYGDLTAAEAAGTLDAERLELLAVSAHCIGRNDDSVEAWGKAYAAHLAGGAPASAALAAAWCSFGLLTRGELVLGRGWLERAMALCEEQELDCVAVAFIRAQMAAGLMQGGDSEMAMQMFEEAGRLAERFADPNTRALARLGRGQCLTRMGRTAEGIAEFDQLMVSITTEVLSPVVAGLVFCAAIDGSHRALDVRRAQTWTAALSRWCDEQPDLVPYRGDCLVHRAEILELHGAWQEAYDEAERAQIWLADVSSQVGAGGADYRLAELHRLRGDYEKAEAAYQSASRRGYETQPGFGLLRLAQGHVNSAAAAIRRALEEAPTPVDRARLLVAQTEISLVGADLALARNSAEELAGVAHDVDVPLLRAQALHMQGAVRLADGDARNALTSLREAWKLWQELDAPYEAARTRVLIGRACRALGDMDTAELEFDAASWVFRDLGAAADLARLQNLSERQPSSAPGGLSLREIQVLRLVAAGMTNRAIADELFLSERTVHRHLSNIFTKLDITSRSAATAYAFKHDLA